MMGAHLPIGIFDSGLGGLTVLRKLVELLPHEDFLYFGDTARVPYGNKSPETIVRYSKENTDFLLSRGVKMIVVACNTASAHAVIDLQDTYGVPVVDVIEPAVALAAAVTRSKRIAVLGTQATIISGIYPQKIKKSLPTAEVISVACPLFVPLVEEGFISHPATRLIASEYLKPVKSAGVDTVILGCTHYPMMQQRIEEELGGGVAVLDSASACAAKVLETLERLRIKRSPLQKGKRKYYVSDDTIKFQCLGEKFLGYPLEEVELQVR